MIGDEQGAPDLDHSLTTVVTDCIVSGDCTIKDDMSLADKNQLTMSPRFFFDAPVPADDHVFGEVSDKCQKCLEKACTGKNQLCYLPSKDSKPTFPIPIHQSGSSKTFVPEEQEEGPKFKRWIFKI